MFKWFFNLFKKKETTALVEESKPEENIPVPKVPANSPVMRPKDLPASNHFASRNRTLMIQEYEYLFPQVKIVKGFLNEAEQSVLWTLRNRKTFEMVENATNIPWWMVAEINIMEMGRNFNGAIVNGDSWKEKTKHYPKGLGPWKSWVDAAIWGLRYEAKGWGFDLSKYVWDLGGCFYFAESYNGHNARMEMGKDIVPANASPYIYSGTQFYQKGKLTEVESPIGSGKYVGKFRPDLVSQQLGFMAFAKALQNSGEELFK